jgi:hypothetical protein
MKTRSATHKTPSKDARKLKKVNYPIQAAPNLLVLNLGTVDYSREHFHNERYIYPIGFKSQRDYCSYIKGDGSRTLYKSEIIDGGDRPIFTVVAVDDPSTTHRSHTVSGCWMSVIKRVKDVLKNRSTTSISGPLCFGLSNPDVKKMIEQLPNAHRCVRYFQNKENEQIEEESIIHPNEPDTDHSRRSIRKRTKKSWNSDYEEDLIEVEHSPRKKMRKGEDVSDHTPRRRRIIRHHGRARAGNELLEEDETMQEDVKTDTTEDVAPEQRIPTKSSSPKCRPVVFDEDEDTYGLDLKEYIPAPVRHDPYEYEEAFALALGDAQVLVSAAVPQPMFLGTDSYSAFKPIKEEIDDTVPFEDKVRRFCRIAE